VFCRRGMRAFSIWVSSSSFSFMPSPCTSLFIQSILLFRKRSERASERVCIFLPPRTLLVPFLFSWSVFLHGFWDTRGLFFRYAYTYIHIYLIFRNLYFLFFLFFSPVRGVHSIARIHSLALGDEKVVTGAFFSLFLTCLVCIERGRGREVDGIG